MVYLRTSATPNQLIVAKWTAEAAVALIVLTVPIVLIAAGDIAHLGGIEVSHLVMSALALCALSVVASCLVTGDEYYLVVLALLLPPIAFSPDSPVAPDWGLWQWIFPPLTSASGLREIALGGAVDPAWVGALAIQTGALLSVAGRSYRRMLMGAVT